MGPKVVFDEFVQLKYTKWLKTWIIGLGKMENRPLRIRIRQERLY